MKEATMSNSTPQKNKFSAAIATIVICVVLAVGAVAISLLSPGSEFEIVPSTAKPGEVHFSEMRYERPDHKALIEKMDELINMINDGRSFTEQSRAFTVINEDLASFKTMLSLAEIHYYGDTTNEFYKTESDFLNQAYIEIYDKICVLLDTIESSSVKVNYERSFFGNNYFDDWTPMTKSPAALELLKTEQALISDYQDNLSNAFVTYNGEDVYVTAEALLALSEADRSAVIELYYQKYNELLGNIYAELIKTRLALAEELGTDYVSYAYESFDRDYTPTEANAYLDSVVSKLIPIISTIEYDPSPLNTNTETITSFYALSLAANKMGDDTKEAFDYMVEYGLYDLTASDNKMGISFELFLEKYNSPFIFVSSNGTANDFLTYAHEFGHFVYDYVNLGEGQTVDSTEIASQAMAYIMPLYSDGMGDISGEDFLKSSIYSTFNTYLYSCFINKFETAVYSLTPDEVNVEKLNELAKKAALEVGINEQAASSLASSWFEIQHIYVAPMYYVSYAISNDVALQILEAELDNPGEGGVKALEELLSKDHALPLYESLENQGFVSPFSEGRAEKIAELINKIFNPEETSSENSVAA